jgi:hypothetical protein
VGVECSAGRLHARAGTGLSVAAGWESRSPSEVERDDQATNPARGGMCRLYELGVAVPIAPLPLTEQSLERKAAARADVFQLPENLRCHQPLRAGRDGSSGSGSTSRTGGEAPATAEDDPRSGTSTALSLPP